MSKNELTTNSGFMSLAEFDLTDGLAQELDGLEGGFERIKIPSAGSTVFEVPGDDPSQPDTVKEFSAVILYYHPLYAYYKSKYTGGNQPPDCGSFDGVTGTGDPGGNCAKCPYNQFGSGENSSKACKNRRRIYVLREGEIFPLLLSLDRVLTPQELPLIENLSTQVKAYSQNIGFELDSSPVVDAETGEVIEPLQ